MLQFSASQVKAFVHRNKSLRWGQAFHQHFKLEKITGQDLFFCDRLYNEVDEEKAKAMVQGRTDYTQ